MSSVSMSPSKLAAADQAGDRKAINEAGARAQEKLGVVSAQADVATGAAKAGLGLQKTKDYLAGRAKTVGDQVERSLRCVAAEAVFSSIVAVEPAQTPESPLVDGAKKTLGVAESNLAALAGARAALGKKVADVPVNLDCTPPKQA